LVTVDENASSRPDPDGSGAGPHRSDGDAPFGETKPGRERLFQEGLDHLQQAARETIAAMRTLLDLAEELVEDPKAAEAMVNSIGSLAEAAARSIGDVSRYGRHTSTAAPPGDEDDGGGVQRIPVS
jgi:hypothetical protein